MRRYSGLKNEENRIKIIFFIFSFIFAAIIIKLFQLQVLKHNHYQEIATRQQYGYTDLPAHRGEIIVKDSNSNEEFLLATNTTLNLLFVDPVLVKDPKFLAEVFFKYLYNEEDAKEKDDKRIKQLAKTIPIDTPEDEVAKILKPYTNEEMKEDFKKELEKKIGMTQREFVLLAENLTSKEKKELKLLNQPGFEVIKDSLYAYPPQIKDRYSAAKAVGPIIGFPTKRLEHVLIGQNRYVVLAKKLPLEASEEINKMIINDKDDNFKGVGMKEEPFRYYPEASLASNVLGYVDGNKNGQYGIEGYFNSKLKGVDGKFQAKQDSVGRQITVGESTLTPAIDGSDIVLTIDRSVQLIVEEVLEKAVKKYQANSGQVVVMNPKTGEVIAMANYPTFDPNNYGDVFEKVEVKFTDEELKNLYPSKTNKNEFKFYTDLRTLQNYPVFKELDDDGNVIYLRYKNYFGPEVYHNKIISWPYEPGSVFKTIVMAAAIDDGDVTPKTTYDDEGPIGVDWNVYTKKYDFEIKNSHDYLGLVDMTTILAESLNTGMTFVANQLGAALFYNYIDRFGFLNKTDIQLENEVVRKGEYFEDWSESELATHSFGQGITVNMLQIANAYSAIVNGGVLMQPFIVKEIRNEHNVKTTEPLEVRRVISQTASSRMVAMLIASVEDGVAHNAKLDDHYVGGKTGTSQTYKNGKALTGVGTTITSFAGFGPVNDPQFVILVKFDTPHSSQWGSATAAPTFKEIAEFLFNYYNIPPDKNQET